MRARWLVPLVIVCAGLGGPAAAAAKFQLKIARIEVNTVKKHHHDVNGGARVSYCAADPYYSISIFYKWSGAKFGQKYDFTFTYPVKGHGQKGHATWFEISGNNADTANANDEGPPFKMLAPGRYAFKLSSAKTTVKASVTLVASTSC
jgi:hypothetical protein